MCGIELTLENCSALACNCENEAKMMKEVGQEKAADLLRRSAWLWNKLAQANANDTRWLRECPDGPQESE